ncbi:hypothetical protein ACSBR2_020419 [Camellia fascicularis]
MNGGDSSDTKDPAIKLFGKTIPLPECHFPGTSGEKSDVGCQIPDKSQVMELCSGISKTEAEDVHFNDSGKQDKSSGSKDGQEEDNPAETSGVDQDKAFKKPDKVISCPRCNSFDTKFCYFNNYNVNQPRHFCKNCQRYWTAGGTMRNVPVGAGRRKNKHFSSQYRQIVVSPDTVPATRIEIPDSVNQQLFSCGESQSTLNPLTSNGTVLKFGPEGRLCESMTTVLHLKDQKSCASDFGSSRDKREDPPSCGSSITASSTQENLIPEKVNELSQPNPLQCYPVPPWVSPWNQAWSGGASIVASRCSSELVSAPVDGNPNPIQWCSTPMLAVPGFCPPSIPVQFVPASYWGCLPVWTTGTRHIPMVGVDGGQSPSSSTSNNLPTLGKHSRDANLMDEESDKCVLVPKTLRIDHSDEASKSSIWGTLGFKSNKKETEESRCGIFKPFKPSGGECKGHPSDTTQVLEANPAALSRSHTFQEST